MHNTLFWFILTLFLVVAFYYTAVPRSHRSSYLLAVSGTLVFLLDPAYACYFFLNIAAIYLIGEYVHNNGPRKRRLFQASLIWLVSNLLFFKYINQAIGLLDRWHVTPTGIDPPSIIFPIGISYLSFRLIHYLIEVYRSTLPRTSFKIFALYILFFPTFLSGPVERFQSFHPQAHQPKPLDANNIVTGLYRILLGLFRKFIIADYTARLIMPVLNQPSNHTAWVVMLCIYGLIFRIYMDLAGYTDMAIGTAKLLGFNIMENFNRPLIQRNIGLYWRNWHISVYTWIRDYIFFPFFSYRASPLKIYMGSFLIVFLFMVWHAGTLGYVAAGIYHGFGIVVWQLFRAYTRPRPSIRKTLESPIFKYLFIFLTYNFISFGVLLYTFEKPQLFSILMALV